MTQKTANIPDEEARFLESQMRIAEFTGITLEQAAQAVKAMAELATMTHKAMNDDRYISVNNVLKILTNHGGCTLEIYREIDEKAISAGAVTQNVTKRGIDNEIYGS